MRRKRTKLITGISIFITCLALLMPVAFAAEPINVAMPAVSVTLTGSPPQDSEDYEIVLKADDPAFPMPEGSEDGEYRLIITGEDMAFLPAVQFSSKGIYTYTVSQTPGSNELAEYDNSLFHLTIYITYAPGGGSLESTVIARRGDEAEKLLDLEFVNNYEPEEIEIPDEEVPGGEVETPDEEEPDEIELPDEDIPGAEAETPDPPEEETEVPKTGDEALIWPYIVSFIGAGILLIVLVLTRKQAAKE
jgi:pilin isopeptide linkage protein